VTTIDGSGPTAPALDATMAASVYTTPGELPVEQLPVPAVGPHDVLLEVSYCGICGSDLHFVLEGWGRPRSTPGHEYSGHIVAVGTEVTDWSVGTLVVGGPEAKCGQCAMCLAGRPSLCAARGNPDERDPDADEHRYEGAFARYVLLPAAQLRRVPDGLDARVAALAEPLAIALHAVTIGRVPSGSSVLVSGAGPIGALITAALVARGITDLTVVEPAPARRELAAALGARRVLQPDDLEVPSIAEPTRQVAGAVDVVFECSGRRRAMEAGLAQLVRGGTLVLVGAGIDPPHFDPNRILLNELVVTGSFNYDAGGFEAALDLLASGALPTDLLIDPADVPLDRVVDAMRRLADGSIAGKVMVTPTLSQPPATRRSA
jgi:2-desacetyl-2-hydroxyethyl bacteriochlorophyllide A dehydrogenase